ncbi:MAG: hypothetical protein M1405_01175 [Patescibacteria group bacterium]|nr:hypothetical protein [Patescibacteria group bacterium]
MLRIKINKNLFKQYRFHIAIAIIVLGALLLPRIPYVSLFAQYSIGFLLWISVIVAIGFKGITLIKIGVASFLILLLLTLLNEENLAEQIGNATYLILSTGIILVIFDTLKSKR